MKRYCWYRAAGHVSVALEVSNQTLDGLPIPCDTGMFMNCSDIFRRPRKDLFSLETFEAYPRRLKADGQVVLCQFFQRRRLTRR